MLAVEFKGWRQHHVTTWSRFGVLRRFKKERKKHIIMKISSTNISIVNLEENNSKTHSMYNIGFFGFRFGFVSWNLAYLDELLDLFPRSESMAGPRFIIILKSDECRVST